MATHTSNNPSDLKNEPYVPMTFWESMEFYRMFVTPLLQLVVIILGAMTAAYGAWGSTYEIALVMTATMALLVCTLAVLPMRYIAGAAAISLVMDMIVMAI